MSCDLLAKWLVHRDSIHLGLTSAGIANGVFSRVGSGFGRICGGYNLYRGVGSVGAADWADVVGAAGAEASVVKNFSWRGHAAGQVYYYVLRAMGGWGDGGVQRGGFFAGGVRRGGGVGGAGGESAGEFAGVGHRGGQVRGELVVRQGGAGGESFAVSGIHERGERECQLCDTDGDGFVSRRGGGLFVGERAYGHGTRVLFGVRAVTAGDVEEENDGTVMGVAQATGPVVHATVLAECGEETGCDGG